MALFSNVFSVNSSMLEPSSRFVDENWGGSLKSKVSYLVISLFVILISLKISLCFMQLCLVQMYLKHILWSQLKVIEIPF